MHEKITVLLLAFITLFAFSACNVASMPEAEESRAASDFMTSVESETPTEETDPSKTQAAAMQVY